MKSLFTIVLISLPVMLFSQTVLVNEDFESGSFGSQWRADSTLSDHWIVGVDSVINGSYSAYVSSDDSTWTYNPQAGYERWLGAIIHIPENEPVLRIKLTWKGRGEPSWDDLHIQLSDTNFSGDEDGGGGGEVVIESVSELNPSMNINHKWISGNRLARTWTFFVNTGLSDTTVKLNFIWTSDGCCWFGEATDEPPQPVMIDDILVESYPLVAVSEDLTVSPGGDFANLDEAWSALKAFGTTGDLTVVVEDGIYDDPVRLTGSVPTTEEGIAHITFEGTGNSVLSFTNPYLDMGDPGDYPAVVLLDDASEITFSGLTFNYEGEAASAIQLLNSSFIEVTNCQFAGHSEIYGPGVMRSAAIRIGNDDGFFSLFGLEPEPQLLSSTSTRVERRSTPSYSEPMQSAIGTHSISINGNIVEGGNFFVYIADVINVSENISITGNLAFSYLTGIHAENFNNLTISGNLILALSMEEMGFFASGISLGTFELPPVEPTFVTGATRTSGKSSTLLRESAQSFRSGLTFSGFQKFLPGSGTISSSAPEPGNQVINNKILTGGAVATGFWPKNTDGIAFYHNTVFSISFENALGTLALNEENTDLIILNNILYAEEGFVISSDSLIDSMDYNILYTGTGIIGTVNGSQADSLKQLQDSTGTNLNSRFFMPDIAGEEMFFFFLNPEQAGNPDYFGTPTFVTTDFSGEIRSTTTPTIGADELIETVPVELTGLSVTALADGVQLNWTTKTERNNYGFEIERRSPALRQAQGPEVRSQKNTWETIGFVAGKGTTNDPQSYSFTDSKVSGKATYRLKQVDFDGAFEYSNEVEFIGTPGKFEVVGNYPNPFNPSTVIRYQLSEISDVSISVYNVIGQKVVTLVNSKQPAGVYDVPFNATGLASGLYVYKVQAGANTATRTMMLTK